MMRATVGDIPAAEDATWGAVFATLLRTHRDDWDFKWRGHRQGEPDAYSVMMIEAPGEDVAALRAEIEAVVAVVNEIVDRDPLKKMVPIDAGLVIVLVD
jgi:hypothetical protein